MMKIKLKNAIQIVSLLIFGTILTCFFVDSTQVLILENEFMVTFIGVILGIAATIITFIFSATDKIWDIIDYTYTDACKKERYERNLKAGIANW